VHFFLNTLSHSIHPSNTKLLPLQPPQVYAPSRTVVVYAPSQFCDPEADSQAFGVPGLAVKGLGPYFQV